MSKNIKLFFLVSITSLHLSLSSLAMNNDQDQYQEEIINRKINKHEIKISKLQKSLEKLQINRKDQKSSPLPSTRDTNIRPAAKVDMPTGSQVPTLTGGPKSKSSRGKELKTVELLELQSRALLKDPEACYELGKYIHQEETEKEGAIDIERLQIATRYLQTAADNGNLKANKYLEKVRVTAKNNNSAGKKPSNNISNNDFRSSSINPQSPTTSIHTHQKILHHVTPQEITIDQIRSYIEKMYDNGSTFAEIGVFLGYPPDKSKDTPDGKSTGKAAVKKFLDGDNSPNIYKKFRERVQTGDINFPPRGGGGDEPDYRSRSSSDDGYKSPTMSPYSVSSYEPSSSSSYKKLGNGHSPNPSMISKFLSGETKKSRNIVNALNQKLSENPDLFQKVFTHSPTGTNSQTQQSPHTLGNEPNEVLDIIFSYLDPQFLIQARTTSKKIKQVCDKNLARDIIFDSKYFDGDFHHFDDEDRWSLLRSFLNSRHDHLGYGDRRQENRRDLLYAYHMIYDSLRKMGIDPEETQDPVYLADFVQVFRNLDDNDLKDLCHTIAEIYNAEGYSDLKGSHGCEEWELLAEQLRSLNAKQRKTLSNFLSWLPNTFNFGPGDAVAVFKDTSWLEKINKLESFEDVGTLAEQAFQIHDDDLDNQLECLELIITCLIDKVPHNQIMKRISSIPR